MNDSTGGGPNVGRFVGGVFGFVFAGIGLTVIIFVWSQPSGFPPLIFRIFGSFIAIAFVAIGGGTAFAAIKGKGPGGLVWGSVVGRMRELQAQMKSLDAQTGRKDDPSTVGYDCPNCGAALSAADDVSPHGDAKCAHCDRWFNIHKRTSG